MATLLSRTLLPALGGFCALLAMSGRANNITASNGTLTGNTGTQVFVEFDVSWQNSWRLASGKWDAAWLFVKFRTADGLWRHCQLTNTGHNASAGHTLTTGLIDPTLPYHAATNYGLGVFLYRSSPGASTLTALDVQLLWNYSGSGISFDDVEEVQVFAIEMVYVPQGSFWLGSGGTEFGSFTNGSWTSGPTVPFQVTSENAIIINHFAGALYGMRPSDPGSIGPDGTLPAAFPKGYNAFYCMKYEVSQQGYVDFLNTLTYTQQVTRTATPPNSAAGTLALGGNRAAIFIESRGLPSSIPARYACNLDGDDTYGEVLGDGLDIACGNLCWGDLAAYLDWCGLRPMTELEFEKACRGTVLPVANEYPWGNAAIQVGNFTLANAGTDGEGIATNYSTTMGNANYTFLAPVHVGCFANNTSNNGRVTSGATYYGIMEMTGNVREQIVSVGMLEGRAFTGTHGNGVLSTNGEHNAANWPDATTASGSGNRGGGFNSGYTTNLPLCDRAMANETHSSRNLSVGGRGVRLAP